MTTETNSAQLARSTGDAYNAAETQSHHHAPTFSAAPSSQSDSTQSILLAEEKGKALYSMRGLAASIKRSLNAERLAASLKPSASSDLHDQKWKPLSSTEAVDTQQTKSSTPDLAIGESHEQDPDSKVGTQPVDIITEPVDSPSTIHREDLIPHEETIRTAGGFQIPNSQLDSSPKFTPYSTLTGAVSFNNSTDSVPVNHNPAPSPEATGVLEDTTTSQIVLHDHLEDPLIPDQPSFEPLSFPHRTPTPPLAATITTVHDDGEVDEEANPIFSSSTPLHEIEIDSQLQYIPSGNENDVEMSSVPGEDHVPTQPDIASSEFSQAWDNDTLMQEADVSTHRAPTFDQPIKEVVRGTIGSPMAEEHPENETKSYARAPEDLAPVLPKTSPIRVQSADSAETSSPDSLPKLLRKSRGKQKFYIAVPPASEWVLQAKRREAERKARLKGEVGELVYFGITLCSSSYILGQHGTRGS